MLIVKQAGDILMDYAAALGNGWRLPIIEELTTLVDYSRVSPATEFPSHPILDQS
jgi:hypothetical protein